MKKHISILSISAAIFLLSSSAYASQIVTFPGHPDCACYEVDDGFQPEIPGGAATHCIATPATVGFTNASRPDDSNNPALGVLFREYVCGAPLGSTPHVVNGGTVMMSYYEVNCSLYVHAPNPAPPVWMSSFFTPSQGQAQPFFSACTNWTPMAPGGGVSINAVAPMSKFEPVSGGGKPPAPVKEKTPIVETKSAK